MLRMAGMGSGLVNRFVEGQTFYPAFSCVKFGEPKNMPKTTWYWIKNPMRPGAAKREEKDGRNKREIRRGRSFYG